MAFKNGSLKELWLCLAFFLSWLVLETPSAAYAKFATLKLLWWKESWVAFQNRKGLQLHIHVFPAHLADTCFKACRMTPVIAKEWLQPHEKSRAWISWLIYSKIPDPQKLGMGSMNMVVERKKMPFEQMGKDAFWTNRWKRNENIGWFREVGLRAHLYFVFMIILMFIFMIYKKK